MFLHIWGMGGHQNFEDLKGYNQSRFLDFRVVTTIIGRNNKPGFCTTTMLCM